MGTGAVTVESVVGQVTSVVASDIDDEKVMMSVEKGEYFGLERVGSRIWEMIENPARVSALVDQLLERFDVDRATCERDVLAFLMDLHDAGIVRVGD